MTSKELSVNRGTKATARETKTEYRLVPPVDIFETDEALTLVADLPGVASDGLQLGVEHDILTLEGQAREGDAGYYRRFQLPDNLDLEKVSAQMRHGVLTVTLPKAAAARPRKIEVTVH